CVHGLGSVAGRGAHHGDQQRRVGALDVGDVAVDHAVRRWHEVDAAHDRSDLLRIGVQRLALGHNAHQLERGGSTVHHHAVVGDAVHHHAGGPAVFRELGWGDALPLVTGIAVEDETAAAFAALERHRDPDRAGGHGLIAAFTVAEVLHVADDLE